MKNPAAVALGKLGGSAKSPRKAQSSAQNGKLGGRPRNWQLLSDSDQNILRGKLLVRFRPDDEVWTLLNHYTLVEHELNRMDDEDRFVGGWRNKVGIPEEEPT